MFGLNSVYERLKFDNFPQIHTGAYNLGQTSIRFQTTHTAFLRSLARVEVWTFYRTLHKYLDFINFRKKKKNLKKKRLSKKIVV